MCNDAEALVPRLAGILKHGVGVNTRVGGARFISQLALRMGPAIRPSSGALIKVPQVSHKSEVVNLIPHQLVGSHDYHA